MSRFQIVLLFSIALYRSFQCVIIATECESNERWKCTNGDCIHINALCDGIKHCSDGSDETEEFCKNTLCAPISYRCDYGACIALNLLCDGVADCVDSSDEVSEKCRKHREEVPPDEVDDETNRLNCAGWGQMKCWSGQCISASGKCNGIRDCDDGSDETSRLCKTMYCKNKQFQCGYGACVQVEAKCNGTVECWDGTDEYPELCAIDRDTTKLNRTVSTTPILTNEIHTTTTIKTTKNSAENTITTTTIVPMLENPIETKEANRDINGTPINGGNLVFETNKEHTSSANINSNKTQNVYNHPKDRTAINKANTTRTLSSTTAERQEHDFDKTPSSKEKSQHASIPKRIPAASAESEDREKKKSNSSASEASSAAPSRNQTQIRGEVQTTSSSNQNSKTFEAKNSNKPDNSSQTHGKTDASTVSQMSTTMRSHQEHSSFISKPTTTPHAPKHNAISLTTTPYTGAKNLSSPPESQKINCTLQDCGHPLICEISQPNSNYSSLLSNASGRLPIEENARITFGCAKGFELVGVEYITCTVGGWSHAKPICTPVCEVDFLFKCKSRLKCLYKKPNMNSAVLITENFNEQKIQLHSQLDFYCGEGYLEGAVSRICTTVGWSKPLPNCINYCYVSNLGGCQRPLNCAIYNSYMGVNVPPEENYWNNLLRENSHIAFSCDYGYKLVGENRSTCNFNGWDNVAPKCLRVCDKSLLNACIDPLNCEIFDEKSKLWLPLLGSVAAGEQITADTYFAFNCAEGYQLEGVKQISCTSNGWSHKMPKCVKIPTFCNGSILRECGNGMICNTFDTVLHEFVEIKGGSKEVRVPVNSQVQLSCPYGNKLEGVQSLTCLENGWNNAMPKCVLPCRGKLLPKCDYPLQCFATYPNEFSKYYPLPTNYASYLYVRGTQVDFFCSKGYTLKGAQQTDCTTSGWSHETTLDLPKCILGCDPDILLACENPLICHYLRPDQNGWLKITKSYKESMAKEDSYIEFECTKGFRLQGASRIKCTSNGWSDDLPKCGGNPPTRS